MSESRRTSFPGAAPAGRALLAAAAAAATSGAWGPGSLLTAQEVVPDSVTTVLVTDTIPGFGAVGGVTVDALGYVYVADFRNSVWRLSPDGQLIELATGLYGASGNAIGPRGYLYQSSFYGNYVSRISRTGEVETFASEGLSGPVGIAAAPSGDLFVANCSGGTVSRIDPDGRVAEFSRSDLFACPNGITFDDRGDLYVVNFNNTKVVRITPDGTASELADVTGAGGNGHIVFARGGFYLTKLRGNRVFRLERDGTFSAVGGTGQAGTDDGPALEATFTRPNGIGAGPLGRELWVNDLVSGPGLGRGRSVVALRRIRLVSLSDVLGVLDPGVPAHVVEAAYDAYKVSRPTEDTNADAVSLAYQWLSGGRVPHAALLFQKNAASYPDDAGAQFNYGELFRYTGQPVQAARLYRRTLELQPDHPTAAARLAQVTG